MMITPMAPAADRRTSTPTRGAAPGDVITRIAAIVPKATAELNSLAQAGPEPWLGACGVAAPPDGQVAPDATAWAIRSPISLVE